MKEQKGFTLIELMVVMAIIAILATSLGAYPGYLKKARDATRLEDIRALETVAISSFDATGQALDYAGFIEAVRAMNNGTLLTDPLDGKEVCLKADGEIAFCGYQYFECTDGGYVLRVVFESTSNTPLYDQDKLNGGTGRYEHSYDIGSCFGELNSETTNFIR